MGGAALEQRVERAAEAALAQQPYVSAIDVLVGLGRLAPAGPWRTWMSGAKAGSSAWNGWCRPACPS